MKAIETTKDDVLQKYKYRDTYSWKMFKYWLIAVTCAVSSSFFIVGSLSLAKIGFILLLAGYPIATGKHIFRLPYPSQSDYIIYCFVGLSGLTLLYAVDRSVGFSHYASLISCLALYVIIRSLLDLRSKLVNVCMFSILYAASLSCIFGILQVVTGRFFVPGTDFRSTMIGDIFRANGLFDDPNYLGYLLTMTWPIAAMLLSRRVILRNVLCTLLLSVALLTFSRATMLIVAFQLLVLAGLFSQNFKKLLFRVALFSTIIIPGLVMANPLGVLDRLLTIFPVFFDGDSSVDNSTAERLDLVTAGLKMFFEHVWLGVGFGNFQILSADYMSFFPRSVYAHNTYITIAAESGVFGIMLYLFFLLQLCRRLLQRGHQFLFVSLLGLIGSNFFLVAHYFPVAYLYFASLVSYNGPRDQND